MFRIFVPLVLLAVAVATLLVSNQLADEPPPAQPLGVAEADFPLLSARRLPTLTTSATPVTAPSREVTLGRDLTALVINAPARSCLVVRQDGEDLFVKDPDVPLTPASLQKLATAHAAMSSLGPDHTFRTVAIAESGPVNGILPSDLYLVGGGDPLLATVEYASLLAANGAEPTSLDELAGNLVAGGLTRIEGGVITVQTRYDEATAVASWPPEWIQAGAAGTLNPVALNQGFQTPEGIVTTAGLLPEPEPALRTAALFDDMLEARAVRIPERPGVAAPERDFSGYVELGSIDSAPLSSYLRFMLAESDNTTAELLLKEVGLAWSGTGSTLDGALATLELLAADAGRPVLVFPPADGSGLSPENELSCRQVTDILEIGGPDGPLASYLPVAGESGTLRNRFTDSTAAGRVRAKTGSLPGVSSLAGFVTGSDGRPITFAAILNGERLASINADAFLQQLLEILVDHPNYVETGNSSAESVAGEG
ncbi:MAG: D-alanyl-D-alanine carboxypeptidase/D-alanyl-D-alanine-endopeptidase [bacterium]|nr:D-alanyl-D-alanine carboxypeptidase/D-alanyl-D-alanine-endopeptidase [bacterium]